MTNISRTNRACTRAMSVLAVSALAVGIAACSDEDTTTTTTTASTSAEGESTSTETTSTTTETSTSEEPSTSAENGDTESSITDPCALLTDEEMRERGATDNSIGVNRPDEFNGVFPGCTFGAFASIYYDLSEGWMGADDEGAEPVSEVGDEAYFDADWNRLTVRFGEERLMFQIGIGGRADVDDVKSTLISMAELVETKL